MAKSMAELGNIGAEDKSKASRVKLADIASASESQAPGDIAVKFALWQPTDEVLVCSSVEDSLPDPEQILLLGNILQAMGQGSGQLPQMDIVEWPPYSNASGDTDEVREFLATLIRARINSKSAKTLLLMGDAASQWLLTTAEKAAAANGQVVICSLWAPACAAVGEVVAWVGFGLGLHARVCVSECVVTGKQLELCRDQSQTNAHSEVQTSTHNRPSARPTESCPPSGCRPGGLETRSARRQRTPSKIRNVPDLSQP